MLKENTRKSNFELLRIIAMFLIVTHHFAVHTNFSFPYDTITFNRLYIQLLAIGGKFGVNIFVLISGYFLISNESLNVSKLIKLWLQIFFYSLLLYLTGIFTGLVTFNIKDFIFYLLPITSERWWFASTYFVLYLFSPCLNIGLKSLSQSQYKKLLILMTICWCIIPTFTSKSFQSNNLITFVYLYSIAGYIKLFGNSKKSKASTNIIICIAFLSLTFLSVCVFDVLGLRWPFFANHATYFYGSQKLPVLIASIFLFLGFEKINFQHNHIINTIASTTFGIYLIHDSNILRPYIWNNILKSFEYQNSLQLLPYSIISIILVFITCSIIEFSRIKITEKLYSSKSIHLRDFCNNIEKHIKNKKM